MPAMSAPFPPEGIVAFKYAAIHGAMCLVLWIINRHANKGTRVASATLALSSADENETLTLKDESRKSENSQL